METPISSLKQPKDTRIAIIGGGFGALMSYTVLRFRGIPADHIAIYSMDSSPERSWERFIRAFRLTHMRSESLGHFFPTDSPGLATVEAVKSWSLKPFILSWFDCYHPTVDFFLTHTRQIARQVGYAQALTLCRVNRIVKKPDGFLLLDEQNEKIGFANNIILAVGHGGYRLPALITDYREKFGKDNLVVHAFEEKDYAPPRRVLIVGDGLTGGTECANVLLEGGEVIVLTRYGYFIKQALNSPREYFSRRGFKPYREQPMENRLQELKTATQGTIKPYRMWMKLFKKAEREGKLQYLRGNLLSIEKMAGNKVQCTVRLPDGQAVRPIVVDQVIVATGFLPATTNPLIAQLIADYKLPMVENILKVRDDFCIDELSSPSSFAAVIGPAAAWAIPCADSLGGMKIVAHQIADLLMGGESWSPVDIGRKLKQWVRLISGKQLI